MTSTDVIKRYFLWRQLRATSRCVKPKSQYGLYLVSWDALYFPWQINVIFMRPLYEVVILCACIMKIDMSRLMTKPTKWLCAQQRLRSAWVSAQSDQSLHCALNRKLKGQCFFMRQWRLWSDWADAQTDLSLRWAHSHFVGFVMRRIIYGPSEDRVVCASCLFILPQSREENFRTGAQRRRTKRKERRKSKLRKVKKLCYRRG